MSGVTVGTVAAYASIAGAGYAIASGVDSSRKQGHAQQQAVQQAVQRAKKLDKQSEIATNRANQKKPNSNAILSRAQQAGKGGQSGTMLTGSQGVDPNSLSLGKNTLLGQ